MGQCVSRTYWCVQLRSRDWRGLVRNELDARPEVKITYLHRGDRVLVHAKNVLRFQVTMRNACGQRSEVSLRVTGRREVSLEARGAVSVVSGS